jgi:hypothetical protein
MTCARNSGGTRIDGRVRPPQVTTGRSQARTDSARSNICEAQSYDAANGIPNHRDNGQPLNAEPDVRHFVAMEFRLAHRISQAGRIFRKDRESGRMDFPQGQCKNRNDDCRVQTFGNETFELRLNNLTVRANCQPISRTPSCTCDSRDMHHLPLLTLAGDLTNATATLTAGAAPCRGYRR